MGVSTGRRFHPGTGRKPFTGSCAPLLRRLAQQRESEVEEGSGRVHMLLSIPPKHSVAQVIGYIKGKSAIHIARESGRPRNVGQHARGYFVSTVGRDEQAIRSGIGRPAKTNSGWKRVATCKVARAERRPPAHLKPPALPILTYVGLRPSVIRTAVSTRSSSAVARSRPRSNGWSPRLAPERPSPVSPPRPDTASRRCW